MSKKKVAVVGNAGPASLTALLMAAAGPLPIGASLGLPKTKEPKGTKPTPESIVRRIDRNQTRLANKANGGLISYPPNHRDPGPSSTRGERRRAQLGRS